MRATSPASTPQGQPARLSPAEESGITPQRASLAVTRRASTWSGVTRAAVRAGVSSASRSSRAAAVAASSSVRALISDSPFSPSAIGSTPSLAPSFRSDAITCSQSAVSSAGRRASLTIRRRQRPADSALIEAGQRSTSPLRTFAWSSSRRSAPCGCCTSTLAQALSARFWSRPGSTTQPRGAWATAISSSRVALAVPVEPAATSTPFGGLAVHTAARRRSSRTRRSLTSTTPSCSNRFGQALSAASRKPRETCQCSASSASTRPASRSPTSTSSICRPSRKRPRASASSRAAEAVLRPPGSSGSSSATSRVSSNRRRSGSIAASRSSARSPGSNGGSPSSRSPRGRSCGGRIARPSATPTKASASARAPRRVGVSTTASAKASGPRGAKASNSPRARSSANGRCAGIVYQRGPGRSKKALTPISPRPRRGRPDRPHASRRRP